ATHLLLFQLLCLAVVSVQGSNLGPEARSASPKDVKSLSAPVGVLDSVLRGKSRQSRCVRCYEDRYYSSGSDRYGGYSSRSGDDPRSASWYYSYDRYDDRGAGRDRDYDRYYGRDDRYAPRTYDRYEGRGYDDYYRRGSYDRGSGYGGGYGGYAAYDSRDRYYGDRYSDNSRDRYYDRSRTAYNSYDKYDPYDRYYSRYDFRNYRPWDETYSRGQSGFDNSGRGYYFAGDDDDSRSGSHPFYDRERAQSHSSPASPASPCGPLISNCPYGDRGTKVSSSAIGSDGYRGGHTSVMGGDKPLSQGGWTYLGDQDKQSSRGGSNGNGGSGSGSNGAAGVAGNGVASGVGGGRDRERDAQSSSYGGRPRPLGGSYLFDRDSNAVPESQSDAANPNGDGPGGDGGGHKMPAAAAQTAPAPNESQLND
ncbi:hypothetical protein KR215_006342, partial [Drosophila sulfurigaster]